MILPIGFVAAFGLLIGSFLNVVAYRVPLGLSVVSPPSACPGCGAEIRARDNVPVLSWLLLRGSCRHCRAPISVRYPVVELLTGLAFLAAAARFVPPLLTATMTTDRVAAALDLAAFLYLMAISVALAVIDIDVRRLPDRIVLPSYAVAAVLLGVAALVRGDAIALGTAAAGAGGSVLLYLALALAKPGGMGLGDVKLAGVLGLYLGYLGPQQLVVGVFAAFLVGGVFGVGLLLVRRTARSTAIPFGPWMLVGTWTGVFFGAQLARLYLSAVGLY